MSLRKIHVQAEWAELFDALPFATFPQSWAYGEVKRSQGRAVGRFLIENNGTPVALYQSLGVRKAGLPVATRIDRGPLFFSEQPAEDTIRSALRAARWACRFPPGGVLFVAPGVRTAEGDHPWNVGFRRNKPGWSSALVDLRKSPEELRRQLAQKWRNQLNKAARSPLAVEFSGDPGSLDWLLERHDEHIRGKGFVSHDSDFWRRLAAAAPNDFTVGRAMLAGEGVSGILIVRFGKFAEYAIGWNGPAGREHNSGNLLLWESMMEMKRRGSLWFDLGGYEPGEEGGFHGFKAGIKGEVYRLAGEWVTA